jgi:hypothetical protein
LAISISVCNLASPKNRFKNVACPSICPLTVPSCIIGASPHNLVSWDAAGDASGGTISTFSKNALSMERSIVPPVLIGGQNAIGCIKGKLSALFTALAFAISLFGMWQRLEFVFSVLEHVSRTRGGILHAASQSRDPG